MAEFDEPVEAPDAAMNRLEAALERIERVAAARAMPPDVASIAVRMDTLIAQLRSALAEATA